MENEHQEHEIIKVNPLRVAVAGICFFVGGVFLLCFLGGLLLDIIKEFGLQILWCLSWAMFGVGAGLWNSRTAGTDPNSKVLKDPTHYYMFFPFVWFVAFLSAFVAMGTFLPQDMLRAYAAAALAGLVVGFLGDQLPSTFCLR